jgi:hypothetical protein
VGAAVVGAAVSADVAGTSGVVTGVLVWAEVVAAGVLGPLAESVLTGPHPASVRAAAARTEAARSHLTGAECVLPIAVPFQRRDDACPERLSPILTSSAALWLSATRRNRTVGERKWRGRLPPEAAATSPTRSGGRRLRPGCH